MMAAMPTAHAKMLFILLVNIAALYSSSYCDFSSWFIARLVIGRTPLQHENPTAIGHQVEVKGLVLTLRGATFRARLCFANLPRRVLPHDCLKYHLYVPS